MNWRKRITWIVPCLALALAGFYVLLTNTLWNVETLDSPIRVRSITSNHLILEDGRVISLPWIKKIPHDNPLFQEAIKDGIEVGANGLVCCLIWIDPTAPHIPVWQKRRVNLSVIAGILDPGGLDDSQMDPKFIANFTQDDRVESIRTYGSRQRRLLGFHWSWLNSFQDDLQRNLLTNPPTAQARSPEQPSRHNEPIR